LRAEEFPDLWYGVHHLPSTNVTCLWLGSPSSGGWVWEVVAWGAGALRGGDTYKYEFFLQTVGLQDGASHCVKILSSMYAALSSDPSDPDEIIKLDLDISNAFNALVQRQLTLDVLGGKASCDYACGLKDCGNIEAVCGELRNMFEYFRTMRTTKSHLRYFDYCGNVLETWGKTGGQQEDPLEMIVFCLSVHHLWGRTLNKHHQDACAVAYTDYGYIKAKLSITLEVLSDVKHVLKEDAGLDLNFDKTKILVKGISAADEHGNNLQDPATWMAPSLCQQTRTSCSTMTALIRRQQHSPRPPSGAGCSAAANADAHPQPQPAGTQDDGHGKLVIPHLNRLHEAFKRSQVSHPESSSSQDQQPTRWPSPIPSQRLLTQQLTQHWPQFKALRQHYTSTQFEEQRQLHLPQKYKATVPESSLRLEINALEEQADNDKACDLYWKPLSWLGTIRPSSGNDAFDPKPMGHLCLHDARFGGSRALLSPPLP
jgi:hypothetical protein